MKREIKFRAWDEDKNEFIDPIYMDGIFYMDEEFRETCENVEQFIGLHDKNGKEIHEGDIIKHGYIGNNHEFKSIHYVFYAEDKAMFYLAELGAEQFNKGSITKNVISKKNGIFEVIGNIHETPELL
jgi:uncharacterized phage protein (TIGR01671 family)